MGNSADSYNLTWKIDSYAPIEEYKVTMRKLQVKCQKVSLNFRFLLTTSSYRLAQQAESRYEFKSFQDFSSQSIMCNNPKIFN